MTTDDLLNENQLVPVVVIKRLEDTIPALEALYDGDIKCAEITLRTSCGLEAIRLAASAFPGMTIGAGTVINAAQARAVIDAGAAFVVSPGISREIAGICREAGVPYLPGCVTPTEIMEALSLGLTTVKFFPANVYGGLSAIKALAGPFPQVKFVPTGGVDLTNIKEFLSLSQVAAIGGSFMMKGDIRENCRKIQEALKA